jgi:hypothetical protein
VHDEGLGDRGDTFAVLVGEFIVNDEVERARAPEGAPHLTYTPLRSASLM